MKLRNEWMSDNEYFGEEYPNNVLLESAIKRFELQRDSSLEGTEAIIDGTPERIVVQNHTNPLNAAKYDKKILVSMDSLTHTGSIVEFENRTWLVMSKMFENPAYKTASVLECINSFTFYKPNISSVPIEVPYVIYDSIALTRMGTDDSKYLSVPESKGMLAIADNEINRNIQRNDIYKLYSKDGIEDNYEIIDLNRVRNPGLIILEMEFCQESQEENLFTLEILNGDNIQVNENDDLTINAQVKNNGEIVNPTPSIVYSSSDETIATIDNSTGVVTILNIGNVTFTAKLASDLTVSSDIDVEVVADAVANYIVELSGDSDIVLGYESTLSAKILDNGIWNETKGVTWTVSNQDLSNTDYVTITSQDSSSIILKASSNTAYKNKIVVVRATFTEDALVYSEKEVKLITLF